MKRSYTILYVDDDTDDLLLISEAFERYTDHLTVVHAGNGVEGLETLDQMHREDKLPCLLVIDINMPIMDGKDMLRTIRERKGYKDLPVVMFSTSRSLKDQEFAEKYEAEFVSKPSKYIELEYLVGQLVNKCRYEAHKTA